MATTTKKQGEPDEQEFELITSSRMLAGPPALRKEEVRVADWPTASGKGARFLLWEMTATDWSEFLESGRVYSKDGTFLRYDNKEEDMRFLAFTVRDQHGNRIFPTVAAAIGVFGNVGKAVINLLMTAANSVNRSRSGEGNSATTPNGSSPLT